MKIRREQKSGFYELPYEEAQKHPDIKQFFGEKYGSKVRVVDIDYSKELCGGTHTHRVSTICSFRIAREGSVASGVRRIEAVTGKEAEDFGYANEDIAEKAAELLKVPSAKLTERLGALLEENKHFSQELKQFKKEALKSLAKELLAKAQKAGHHSFIGEVVSVDADLLPDLVENLIALLKSGVIVLGTKAEGRCQLLARVSSDLTQKGIQAVQLIKAVAPAMGGSGGGKAESAQAGGKKS